MKRLFSLFLLSLVAAVAVTAQEGYVPSPENVQARKDFQDKKFGIFIHWGIYSMMADGEWVMQNRGIDCNEYKNLARGFYPSQFNAAKWVEAIKGSGARYITITSRHHDGFSMFGTKASPYNVVDATPFHRDVIGELAAECHKQGVGINFYYSHLDWGRPDYYPLGRTGHDTGRTTHGNWKDYQAFMKQQLTELLSNYGKVGCIWFDGVWDKDSFPREQQPAVWGLYDQYALIHKLQPACLIGNNHHLATFPGEDIQIFERDIPGQNTAGMSGQEISVLPLETCETMNGMWGYRIVDKNYKSVDEIVRYLVKTAGMNANLLLNIGPRPDGSLPDEALDRLAGVGRWLKSNGATIYETRGGIVAPQAWGVTTQRARTLFVHILNLKESTLTLPIKGNKVKEAKLFDGGKKVKFKQNKEGVTLSFDEIPSGVDYIVELTFNKNL